VNQALPRLPDVTRNLGVTTVKSSPDLTMVVHLRSPTGRYDMLYLRNYAVLNVKEPALQDRGCWQRSTLRLGRLTPCGLAQSREDRRVGAYCR